PRRYVRGRRFPRECVVRAGIDGDRLGNALPVYVLLAREFYAEGSIALRFFPVVVVGIDAVRISYLPVESPADGVVLEAAVPDERRDVLAGIDPGPYVSRCLGVALRNQIVGV